MAVAFAGILGGCNGDEPAVRAIRANGAPIGDLVLDLSQQAGDLAVRVDRSRYDFDRANKSEYLLEGWGRPETSADGELTFAWATSRRASVKLGVRDTASYWLHVRSRAAAAAPDVGQTASITLNGHAIGSTAVEPGGFRVHSFAVPDDALISGDNVVAFSFTYAEASADPLARDPRSLAAAFDYVALTQRPEPPPISGRMERETSLPATTGAIRQVTGTESAFRVRVPEQGVLDFGVEKGQSEKVDAASPLHAEVIIRRDEVRGGPHPSDRCSSQLRWNPGS